MDSLTGRVVGGVGVLIHSRPGAQLHVMGTEFTFFIDGEPDIQIRRNIMRRFRRRECVSVNSHDRPKLATRELHPLQASDHAIVPPLSALFTRAPIRDFIAYSGSLFDAIHVSASIQCYCQAGFVSVFRQKLRPQLALARNVRFSPLRGNPVTDGRRFSQSRCKARSVPLLVVEPCLLADGVSVHLFHFRIGPEQRDDITHRARRAPLRRSSLRRRRRLRKVRRALFGRR